MNKQDWVFLAAMATIFGLIIEGEAKGADVQVNIWRDRMGNVYPPECRRDLAKDPTINVLVIAADMDPALGGITHPVLVGGRAMVLLQKNPQPFQGMTAAQVDADNRQHELCHAVLLTKGKSPHFHGAPK